MKCLSNEQLVAYLRSGAEEARLVESHVRQCPGCAMELLLAREVLSELGAKSIRPGTDRLGVVRPKHAASRGVAVWLPWASAAAVMVAATLLAVLLSRKGSTPPLDPAVALPPVILRPKGPSLPSEAPREEPAPPANRPIPAPESAAPKTRSEPRTPEPAPSHPVPAPEAPAKGAPNEPAATPSTAPLPESEPKKAAPTLVEKAVVARVIHSIGTVPSAVGRLIRAGELLVTARSEFLEVAVEGYGQMYFRENSQVEIGSQGDIFLHEGEMLARLDTAKPPGEIKTPIAVLEPQSRLFNVLAGKASTELSFLAGHFKVASTLASGPSTVLLRTGKPPEIKPLEPGFATWLPEKLGAKAFTGWYEAEEFPVLQGFKAMPYEQASGRQAAVQISDPATLALKAGLPFKGRYAVWIRVRQHEAKAAAIGIRINGQAALDFKLEFSETKSAWRWVGPLVVSGDRLDLGLQALSRWPLKEGEPARSFPVVVDAVMVTSDLKAVPPEKPGESSAGLSLSVDEAQK